MARGFLQNNFINSMSTLTAQHNWRSRFDDQLNIVYKDWLLKKVNEEFFKDNKVEDFLASQQGVIGEQLVQIEKTKEPIKRATQANNSRKERLR